MVINMKKSNYNLLYNQLWLANPNKVKQLSPDYIEPTLVNTKLKSLESLSSESASIAPSVEKVLTKEVSQPILKVNLMPNSVATTSTNLILDWNVLVDKINNCTLCNLCDGRTNVVIERGNRSAPWLFVGEGPGEEEDRQGISFVGKSGQLLDKMIAAMKLNKDTDVYICNVVKCRPPYNRNPEIEEINSCSNYLFSQIELVKPKIILTLGRFASQTLLNSNLAVGKLRNQVHKFRDIPLIVSYHPAYLLRNPDAKKDAWSDLQLALKVYG